MKYEFLFICIAAAVLVPSVQAAYIINPGQSHNCTEAGQLVSCGICTSCNTTCEPGECPGCSIDEEISPGEKFRLDEGVCDVRVECKTCEESELEPRDYHMEMAITKLEEEEAINLGLEIRDFTSAIIETKHYEFDSEDIASIRYKYDFVCPTKVYFENINFQTCSAFFDDYMNESEPLMFQLATGTSECMQELLNCKGNQSADHDLAMHYKDMATDYQTKNDVLTKQMSAVNDTMFQAEQEVRKEVEGTIAAWQGLSAILGFVLFCVIFFGIVYSRPEGGRIG